MLELAFRSKTTRGVIGEKILTCAVFHGVIVYVCRSRTQLEDSRPGGRAGGGARHDCSIFPTENIPNGLHTCPPSSDCPVLLLGSVCLQQAMAAGTLLLGRRPVALLLAEACRVSAGPTK